MNIKEIEQYLQKKNEYFSNDVMISIEAERQEAIQQQDEEKANHLWCLAIISYIQNSFVSVYHNLKNRLYLEAWRALKETDLQLYCLEENYKLPEGEEDVFNLKFIRNTLPEYEKLFPYEYFVTRETVIRKQKCSICGKEVSLRNGCGHVPGKVYMGEFCVYETIDAEYKNTVVVQDPFDKYEILQPYQMDYNYDMLDALVKSIHSPYDFWFVEIVKEKNPQFAKIGRNDPCVCGSGKKFKHCCMNDPEKMYFEHYTIRVMNEPGQNVEQTLKMI